MKNTTIAILTIITVTTALTSNVYNMANNNDVNEAVLKNSQELILASNSSDKYHSSFCFPICGHSQNEKPPIKDKKDKKDINSII
jgi:hypothetical protein